MKQKLQLIKKMVFKPKHIKAQEKAAKRLLKKILKDCHRLRMSPKDTEKIKLKYYGESAFFHLNLVRKIIIELMERETKSGLKDD